MAKKKSAVSAPIVLVFMIALIGIAAGILLILNGSREDGTLTAGMDDSSLALDVETPSETTTEVTTTTTETETTTTTTEALPPGSVTDLTLSFYTATLQVGGRAVMPIVTMLPEDATDKSEKWESSDESVAKVDWQGSITPVGAGHCTVRVTSVNNPNVYAEVDVVVVGENGTAAPQTTAGSAGGNGGTDAASTAGTTAPQTAATTPNNRSDIQVIDGITYVQGLMIVNKTYSVPADYNPGGMTAETKAAFTELQNAASADGLSLYSVSDFRSYETQRTLYNNYVARDGQAAADRYSARPGNSEHQTGLAIDCNCAGDAFIGTPEAIWLAEHSWEYGFIVRYGKDKEALTGYKYEPWHIRYVGKEWAKKIYDSGLCLEEYFNIDSVYPN